MRKFKPALENIGLEGVGNATDTRGHEILKATQPHPTMSEAMMEAVAEAYGEVIHL